MVHVAKDLIINHLTPRMEPKDQGG